MLTQPGKFKVLTDSNHKRSHLKRNGLFGKKFLMKKEVKDKLNGYTMNLFLSVG